MAATEKRLAGDERAGWSARYSIRQRHRSVLRERWRLLAVLGTSLASVSVLASIFATGPLQRGFILGSGLVVAVVSVSALVVLASGTAPLMMGELAEQWTAQELRELREHGWKLVNHFGLGYGDQDHVLVGPGGVILVETKWGATPWDLDERDHFFNNALQQTARNAKQLELWFGVAQHGRPPVEPVLVLWGRAKHKLDEQPVRRHRSGVVVMSGDQLQTWMLGRRLGQLAPDAVAAIWSNVERQVEKRDEHELRTRPMPRSAVELSQTLLACVVAALVGPIVLGQALLHLDFIVVACLVGPALVGVAELARHRAPWRWQARAFQAGIVSTYCLGAFAVGQHYLAS